MSEKLTPTSQISVAEAENLAGTTITEADLMLASSLGAEVPQAWDGYPFELTDWLGFSSVCNPSNPDIQGYSAGKPGYIPLVLAVLLTNPRTFYASSALTALLAQKGLHRWFMAIRYEGGLLRHASWDDRENTKGMPAVPARLLDLHRLCDKSFPYFHLNIGGLHIPSMLDYGIKSMYPGAFSNVLCCSKQQAEYWASGVYPAVAQAAEALVHDLLERCRNELLSRGVEVIEHKWVQLPGYEPLFDSEDITMF